MKQIYVTKQKDRRNFLKHKLMIKEFILIMNQNNTKIYIMNIYFHSN